MFRLREFLKFLLLVFFLFPSSAVAESKDITAEGTYNMGDSETPIVAESRARLDAMRNAAEQAGVYIESYSKVKNSQLTHDEIQVLTSAVMDVTILDKKRDIIGDGVKFWVKIKAKVVLGKIEEMSRRIKEKSVLEDYKRIQEAYDKSQKEIQALKKQLAEAKNPELKNDIKTKIAEDERLFQANEWFEKGYHYGMNKEHDKAMEAFTRAIQLNPQYARAYGSRSFAYSKLGNPRHAIEDASKAIELDPGISMAYVNRAHGYGDLGKFPEALADTNKAIELDPKNAMAYGSRSFIYSNLGNYQSALADASKAIELDPKLAQAYVNRSLAYGDLGNYQQVLEDSNKAIELDPKFALAYVNRSFAHMKLRNYQRALEDANKAIGLAPKNALGYANRGDAYSNLGNYERAINDYKTAAGLGHKKAQEFLDNFEKQQKKNIEGNNLKTSSENNLRIFQPGDYINYKVTGFVNAGGDDVPVLGTAQYKVVDETQVDYYGNRCKIFRMTMDFTVLEKDRSKRVTKFVDLYFIQDLHGSLMIHGGKDSEKGIPSFVKTPSTGWYFSWKCPLNAHESLSQNVELTDGSSINGTDMVLSEERISVPAGVFSGVKTISNTLTTNADLSKTRNIETTWIVPEIGPVRTNIEYTYDKRRMKLILEMTDTKISHKKEVEVAPTKVEQRPSLSTASEIGRDGRFIAYDNGTVIDTRTGLMWAAKDNGSDIKWPDAKRYCENYRGGGYTDWRMPTLDELAALYDSSKSRPAECSGFFKIHVATELIDITCFAPWTSETLGSEGADFSFRSGDRNWSNPSLSGRQRALPVRSGK